MGFFYVFLERFGVGERQRKIGYLAVYPSWIDTNTLMKDMSSWKLWYCFMCIHV